MRPRSYIAGAVVDSAALLHRQVSGRLDEFDKALFLCQSRGGLDTLWALTQHPDLLAKTAGVILVQTPSGPSAVMQSILTNCYSETFLCQRTRTLERIQKAILTLRTFRQGCRDLTSPAIDKFVESTQSFSFPFPVLSVATWAVDPTSWVDSFHDRLREIRPGCAHDGQFYLEDQIWPDTEQLILGHLDHAQTVMGGQGFDSVKFWMTLIHLLADRDIAGVNRSATP